LRLDWRDERAASWIGKAERAKVRTAKGSPYAWAMATGSVNPA